MSTDHACPSIQFYVNVIKKIFVDTGPYQA
jgi:hypothetical protein